MRSFKEVKLDGSKSPLVKFTYLADSTVYTSSLWIGLLSGFFGILPDIDHPLELILSTSGPRGLHPLFFFSACGIIFCCCAYLGGLFTMAILRRLK